MDKPYILKSSKAMDCPLFSGAIAVRSKCWWSTPQRFFTQPRPRLIRQSDRGLRHSAEVYRTALAQAGIAPSMGRKGDRWVEPSKRHRLVPDGEGPHGKLLPRPQGRTRPTPGLRHARRDLFGYTEGFYKRCRLHLALGYITPAVTVRRSAYSVHFSGEDQNLPSG